MKILLHICCGPCSIYPISQLQKSNCDITGYLYNPNIHPYKEFKRRLLTAEQYLNDLKINAIIDRNYGLIKFLREVVSNEKVRCEYCYKDRLEQTAITAKNNRFDSFSTTLLYSKYQNHLKIKEFGEKLASEYSLHFHYDDFRLGWQQGIDRSKELEMYRQPYCGCIYSEQERYDKKFRKRQKIKV